MLYHIYICLEITIASGFQIYRAHLIHSKSDVLQRNQIHICSHIFLFKSTNFPPHCNFHLHSTVTLTVAVAGVSTPLLAVH